MAKKQIEIKCGWCNNTFKHKKPEQSGIGNHCVGSHLQCPQCRNFMDNGL